MLYPNVYGASIRVDTALQLDGWMDGSLVVFSCHQTIFTLCDPPTVDGGAMMAVGDGNKERTASSAQQCRWWRRSIRNVSSYRSTWQKAYEYSARSSNSRRLPDCRRRGIGYWTSRRGRVVCHHRRRCHRRRRRSQSILIRWQVARHMSDACGENSSSSSTPTTHGPCSTLYACMHACMRACVHCATVSLHKEIRKREEEWVEQRGREKEQNLSTYTYSNSRRMCIA